MKVAEEVADEIWSGYAIIRQMPTHVNLVAEVYVWVQHLRWAYCCRASGDRLRIEWGDLLVCKIGGEEAMFGRVFVVYTIASMFPSRLELRGRLLGHPGNLWSLRRILFILLGVLASTRTILVTSQCVR